MTPLKTTFRSDGFDFKQIAREGRIAVYEQSKGSFWAWEVIIIGKRPPRVLNGVALGASERYPASEQWGSMGWTCMSRERAFEKMDALLAVNR